MKTDNIPTEAFVESLLQIDRIGAADIFEHCFMENNSFEALEQLTMNALEQIGKGWEEGHLSLSQIYMSGTICEELIEKYLPKFDANSYKKEPRLGIAVLQDHHVLGKKIIYSVIRARGYDLIDLGQGLSPEAIVEKTIDEKIDILLISTLMFPSALKVKKLVEILREKKLPTKVIVGGAPFRLDPNLWQKVNADADGKIGTDVIDIIEQLAEGGLKR